MEKKYFGVMIKVQNMDACRHFYRTLLNLGEPSTDSNIWVEFDLPNGGILVLEKTEEELNRTAHMRWVYATDDVQSLITRLGENGFPAKEEFSDALGFKLYEFSDPDGNPFLVYPIPAEAN